MEHKYYSALVNSILAIAILMLGFVSVGAQTRRGKASYYSKRATGARTSSGERLHHDSLTCAHLTYPFGTQLKVTNLRNGKSVVVRVTDRGPRGRGRLIDLSYGAARALGMLSQGIAMVEVEPVGKKGVPYRDDAETGLPDFDFDFEGMRQSFLEDISKVKFKPLVESGRKDMKGMDVGRKIQLPRINGAKDPVMRTNNSKETTSRANNTKELKE